MFDYDASGHLALVTEGSNSSGTHSTRPQAHE